MRIYYTDSFVLPLPEGHRFPMAKYALLRERVAAELSDHELCVPPAAAIEQLVLAHDRHYVDSVLRGSLDPASQRRIGFPWSAGMVERSRRSVGATIAAAYDALRDGWAASLAGGTHHAYADRGEGFCVFNDIAVTIRLLQNERAIRRCAVIDLDVHQGNGTARIFRDDPAVFTLSVHGANNFPFRKETSRLDIALPDKTADQGYLDAVRVGLDAVVAQSADIVFYIAGADPYERDRLGRLSVSKAALRERDRLVYDAGQRMGVPVVTVMGGGYAADVGDVVDIHFHAVREAAARSGHATN